MRVTDEFLNAVLEDGDWNLTYRGNGKVAKTVKARELWEKISYAAWACADPGIQFHTTDQRLAHLPGRRRNPRLQSVLGIHVPGRHGLQSRLAEPDAVPQGRRRRRRSTSTAFEHAVRLWTIVLEISVLMAQFPSQGNRAALL